MYLVVSRWEALPGKEAEFEQRGISMRDLLRKQPGVKLVEAFGSNGTRVVVHGYEDEATYDRVISDPNGPFVAASNETGIETVARWLGSEKGTTV
jgi:hypothetical protein